MGKMNMGILGGFSGTVGTVIGSSNRKGEDIIRVKSKKPRTSSTEGQINQRSKFSLVTVFLQALNFLLKIGFKKVAGDLMSPYNYACQFALKNAITGEGPDFEIDYSKVLISDGDLSQVKAASAELTEGNVNFEWEDNTANSLGESTDKAMMLVYNANNHELSYSTEQATRMSASGIVPIPNGTAGDKLVVYLFFQSASDPTLVSTSQYLGSVTMI
jgi:hypothetical protein